MKNIQGDLDYEQYQRIKKFPIFNKGQNKGGFIHETEVVDINRITQYVLIRLNQATEKNNAEMINNYQNILGIINQKNNGLNGVENNPHHL